MVELTQPPMPIRILSEELAAKIAAGEVIERPSSVVKELIENSLDAGSHDIRIEVRGGGQRLLRVADDGCGIPADQVVTAFARHATSKIQTADDLFAIRTLGFRGEALPTIAAVARVTLITHAEGEDTGTLIKLDGGRRLAHHPHGASQGTVVTSEELFRNVPARLKFLKAPGTEAGHIVDLVGAYAMAYPSVRFSLVNDGRLVLQTAGNGKLQDVMAQVLGTETSREMIPAGRLAAADSDADRDQSDILVSGFVSPPSVHRGTRKGQFLFVNGRWIEDRSLSHAVLEAYHTLLMVGRFPLFILQVELPADAVDVNVHPTKSQVRFRDPGEVYRVVQRSVRRALTAAAPIPAMSSPNPIVGVSQVDLRQNREFAGQPPSFAHGEASWAAVPPVEGLPVNATLAPTAVPMLRVIGQIASTYIIAEGPDGLYLVDQHAAHERVLYDQLISDRGSNQMPSQQLLEPVAVSLSLEQLASFEAHRAPLERVGFLVEPFGSQTLMIRALPAVLKNVEPRAALLDVLGGLSDGGAPLDQDEEKRLIASICKSGAVKGGQSLSLEEMRALIRDLEKTGAPRTCPHGRPTMIQLNLMQLEREFGRR